MLGLRMTPIRLPFLVLGLWLSCLGQALAEPAVWSRPSPNSLRVSGVLGQTSYDDYKKQADQGFDLLVLDRVSGKDFVALRIAQDVIQRQVALRIDHSCIEGCARFLMYAGRTLSVDCNSVLALGHSQLLVPTEERRASLLRFIPRRMNLKKLEFDAKIADYLVWYEAHYRQAQAFLAQVKAPTDWLTRGPSDEDVRPKVFNTITGQFEWDPAAPVAVVMVPPPTTCATRDSQVVADRIKELNLNLITLTAP
jgi:hypothetical protein